MAGLVAEEARVEANHGLVEQGARRLDKGRELLGRDRAPLEELAAADGLDREGNGEPGAPGHELGQQGVPGRLVLRQRLQRFCVANHFILDAQCPVERRQVPQPDWWWRQMLSGAWFGRT